MNTDSIVKAVLCILTAVGLQSFRDVNECTSNRHNCQNGATCVKTPKGYNCTCTSGYTGRWCGDDVDECTSNIHKCLNGATCVNTPGSYTCICPSGYTGRWCVDDVDECTSNIHKCLNGATCVNTPGSYTCICPSGYTGRWCGYDVDECTSNRHNCPNWATCENTLGGYTCTCPIGYTGRRCGDGWGVSISLNMKTAVIAICVLLFITRILGLPSFRDKRAERERREELTKLKKKRENLREKIKSYTIGDAADIRIPDNKKNIKPNIALFGLTGSGKSTFINALLYSITGKYQEYGLKRDKASEGGRTIPRNKVELKMLNFNLIENRGMQGFSVDAIRNVLSVFRGDPPSKIEKKKDEEFHCPVLVLNGSNLGKEPYEMQGCQSFIKEFSQEMEKFFGRSPMFVLTNKRALVNVNNLEPLKSLLDGLGIPNENILVLENYTKEKHREDIEKDIQLLEFTWEALALCDYNMHLIARKEKEKTLDQTGQIAIDDQISTGEPQGAGSKGLSQPPTEHFLRKNVATISKEKGKDKGKEKEEEREKKEEVGKG